MCKCCGSLPFAGVITKENKQPTKFYCGKYFGVQSPGHDGYWDQIMDRNVLNAKNIPCQQERREQQVYITVGSTLGCNVQVMMATVDQIMDRNAYPEMAHGPIHTQSSCFFIFIPH